jgi:hypothetical protein
MLLDLFNNVMADQGLINAVTAGLHLIQAGFRALLLENP